MQSKSLKKIGLLISLVITCMSSHIISAMEELPDERDLESSGSGSDRELDRKVLLNSSELRHRDRSTSSSSAGMLMSRKTSESPNRLEDGIKCIGLACCYCTVLCCWRALSVHKSRSEFEIGLPKQD